MNLPSIHAWLAASLVLAFAGTMPASAQDFGLPGLGAADPGEPVTVTLEIPDQALAPGSGGALAVVIDHLDGFHSWPARELDLLPKEIAEFAIHTSVAVDAGDSPVAVGAVQWPTPYDATVADPLGGAEPITIPTFAGRAVAFVPFVVSPDAEEGSTITFALVVDYQACDEMQCLIPETKEFGATFEVGSVASPPPSEGTFAGFDASAFDALRTGLGVQAQAPSGPVDGDIAAPADNGRTFFGIPIPEGGGAAAIVVLMLLASAGGMILNLTPCVLPVIPIKVMTISHHAGSPGKSLLLGLWMAAGVVMFWVGLGVPYVFLTSVTDPSQLFGIWWVTLAIGLLIGAMGVGSMGLFTITLPQSVYRVNPKADSAWGSFLFGVMTAVLGLPCFGFVAGALLAGAAALPPAAILAIFLGLGLGMALPYLVLSAAPSLVERIPRTGPGSELVKQVMGLLLLAAAAYFVGSGLIALVNERPWLAKQLHWWTIALLATFAGLWLVVRTLQITKKVLPRAVFGAVGLVLAGVAVLYAVDSTAKARDTHEQRVAARAAAGGGAYLTTVWNDYTPALVERARADGKTVVLDFTAEWCLNCKALKAAVLNRDPVKTELAGDEVVAFTVDLTSTKAPGWQKLRDLGQTGIPLLAVYGPGDDQPWLANNYTSGQVMQALNEARNPSGAVSSGATEATDPVAAR